MSYTLILFTHLNCYGIAGIHLLLYFCATYIAVFQVVFFYCSYLNYAEMG